MGDTQARLSSTKPKTSAFRLIITYEVTRNSFWLFSDECFRRFKFACSAWILSPTTWWWWISFPVTTSATGTHFTAPAGWWPVRPTRTCQGGSTCTRTPRAKVRSGWNRLCPLTNWSSPTTCWTTMGMWVYGLCCQYSATLTHGRSGIVPHQCFFEIFLVTPKLMKYVDCVIKLK